MKMVRKGKIRCNIEGIYLLKDWMQDVRERGSGKRKSLGDANQESSLTRLNLRYARGEVIIQLGIEFLSPEKYDWRYKFGHHQHIHGQ